ncbi:MAG: histidine phosphatase family protein [Actinomycetes bacterium]
MEGLPDDPAARVGAAAASGGGVLSRRLVLWRHGRTEWNATGRIQGQLNPPLDFVGRQQAVRAAMALSQLSPAVIVASDLERAASTAYELSKRVEVTAHHDVRLREIGLGQWEGLLREEVEERFPGEFTSWMRGEDIRRGGGETYAEVGARGAQCVLEAMDNPDGLVVAVTHGGTARSVIGVLLELDPASWWRLGPLGNCRWSVLIEGEHGWRLVEHNAGVPDVAVADEEHAGDDAR